MYQKSWHKCTKNHDTSVPKIMIICYSSWDKVCDDVIVVFILGYFLPFCPPNSSKNQDFVKLKKAPEDIIILHMCLKNYDKMLLVPEIWCATDGRTVRRTDGKSDILGVPPKNICTIESREKKETFFLILLFAFCIILKNSSS